MAEISLLSKTGSNDPEVKRILALAYSQRKNADIQEMLFDNITKPTFLDCGMPFYGGGFGCGCFFNV